MIHTIEELISLFERKAEKARSAKDHYSRTGLFWPDSRRKASDVEYGRQIAFQQVVEILLNSK